MGIEDWKRKAMDGIEHWLGASRMERPGIDAEGVRAESGAVTEQIRCSIDLMAATGGMAVAAGIRCVDVGAHVDLPRGGLTIFGKFGEQEQPREVARLFPTPRPPTHCGTQDHPTECQWCGRTSDHWKEPCDGAIEPEHMRGIDRGARNVVKQAESVLDEVFRLVPLERPGADGWDLASRVVSALDSCRAYLGKPAGKTP